MSFPHYRELSGRGMPMELAAIISEQATMPSARDLGGFGLPHELALELGGKAYAARPLKARLIGLGMSPELANVLGQ